MFGVQSKTSRKKGLTVATVTGSAVFVTCAVLKRKPVFNLLAAGQCTKLTKLQRLETTFHSGDIALGAALYAKGVHSLLSSVAT